MPFRRLRITAALLLLAVILLGLAVGAGWADAADWRISHTLALRTGVSSEGLIVFMQAVSFIGGGIPRWVIVIALSALVWRWCGPRCGVALAGASLLSNLASSLMKIGFDRARPDLIAHLDHVSSASYPSGHATSAAVVYLLLAWLAPPRWRGAAWAITAVMILLGGLSRIMLGVHWASDVVGGTLLGAAFALLGAWWARRGREGPAQIPLS